MNNPPPNHPPSDREPSDAAADTAVTVPVDALSPEALLGLIDDFILREGTDYGERETDLESKRRAVRVQLDRGSALIKFDPATQSTTLVPADT